MRLLLDANLSPRLVEMLSAGGVEAVHVGDLGLLQATNEAILDAARNDQMVVVTADSDFPMSPCSPPRHTRPLSTSATSPSIHRRNKLRCSWRTFLPSRRISNEARSPR